MRFGSLVERLGTPKACTSGRVSSCYFPRGNLGPGTRGPAGHFALGGGVVVNVSIALSVAGILHERGHRIAQVKRYRLARRFDRIGRRRLYAFMTRLDLGALAR